MQEQSMLLEIVLQSVMVSGLLAALLFHKQKTHKNIISILCANK